MMYDFILAPILLGVAAYRAWRIIALDTITERPRAWLLDHDDRQPWRFLGDLILCPWCLGFWISGLLTLGWGRWVGWEWMTVLIVWLATSAVCGWLGARDA